MRVEPGKQATSRLFGDAMRDRSQQDSVNHESASRALIVTVPETAASQPQNYRQAPFLAHLIATRELAPQTRERRRAEPGEALAAYRAVAALMKSGQ